MKHYGAHWGVPLIIVSLALTILCAVRGYQAFTEGGTWMGLALLALVVGCALFTVRGYTITPEAILIHRLLWATLLPRTGLQSATFEPRAMRWSIRCGNGGFFSNTGLYWSKPLGVYRAFVTDGRRTVVLRYTGCTVVVSPSSPEEFVRALVPSQATTRSIG
jgi:hypothetical protein